MNEQKSSARAALPLRIRTELSLQDLAHFLSKELLGGAEFKPVSQDDEHIVELYQDVPALRVYLLGLALVLQGYSGSDGYFFDVFSIVNVPDPLFARRDTYMATHIGGLLLDLEERVGGFELVGN